MTSKFDFVRRKTIFFLISAVVLTAGIISLFVQQLNLGIDFESGTRLDITIQSNVDIAKGKETLRELGYDNPNARVGGKDQEILIFRTNQTLDPNQIEEMKQAFNQAFATQVSIQEQVVDPIIGRELAQNALYSVLIASVAIIIYVSIRFEYRFAIAAIIALLHDALFTVGMFSILQVEVDIVFIAAVLTIVGYSVNDTIVIFDRIRENLGLHEEKLTPEQLISLVNRSIQETLVRSINTALTVIFAVAALYVFGGESIRNFALALMFGLFSGVYSSIFIASQVWVSWKIRSLKKDAQSVAS